MPGVRAREGEAFDKMLRRFKKVCERSGIAFEMRKHQHFEKPSERKKRKLNASRRRRIKFEDSH